MDGLGSNKLARNLSLIDLIIPRHHKSDIDEIALVSGLRCYKNLHFGSNIEQSKGKLIHKLIKFPQRPLEWLYNLGFVSQHGSRDNLLLILF